MKDFKKRSKGKYKEEFIKNIDGKNYKIIEEYSIGRNYEILNFSRSYSPPIPYKKF
jgi:hypothetical protein